MTQAIVSSLKFNVTIPHSSEAAHLGSVLSALSNNFLSKPFNYELLLMIAGF
ncbi:hypothetical protein H6G64_33405 [Calothrix sp. FACHB-156]|nr:hypothetical protein [Calothrix sp. FACHB-156]